MKKCPRCKRTYADDSFTFCLEDGTLLSAPYEIQKTPAPNDPGEAPTMLKPKARIAEGPLPTIAASPPVFLKPTAPPAAVEVETADHLSAGTVLAIVLIVVISVIVAIAITQCQ
jgi:hypothetical protein